MSLIAEIAGSGQAADVQEFRLDGHLVRVRVPRDAVGVLALERKAAARVPEIINTPSDAEAKWLPTTPDVVRMAVYCSELILPDDPGQPVTVADALQLAKLRGGVFLSLSAEIMRRCGLSSATTEEEAVEAEKGS